MSFIVIVWVLAICTLAVILGREVGAWLAFVLVACLAGSFGGRYLLKYLRLRNGQPRGTL